MPEQRKSVVETVAIWASVCVSLTTLGVLIWRGGAIAQTVATDSERISRIESSGSGKLQAHESMDDVRVAGLDKRLSNVEQSMATISAMQADIREIRTRIEMYFKAQNGQANNGKQTGGVVQW